MKESNIIYTEIKLNYQTQKRQKRKKFIRHGDSLPSEFYVSLYLQTHWESTAWVHKLCLT